MCFFIVAITWSVLSCRIKIWGSFQGAAAPTGVAGNPVKSIGPVMVQEAEHETCRRSFESGFGYWHQFYGTSVWQTQLTFNIFEIDKINYVNGTPLYHTVTTCSAALRCPGFRSGFVIHTKLTSITQECPLKSYLLRPEIERNRLEVCVQVLHPCFFHIFPARVEKK